MEILKVKVFVLQLIMLLMFCVTAHDARQTLPEITFKSIQEVDLPMVFDWVHQPFVKPWFEHEAIEWDQFLAHFHRMMASPTLYGFIMQDHDYPFGYIRYYAAFEWPDGFGNFEPEGTYGIALYIGDPDYIGKGYGTFVLRQFIQKMIDDQTVTGCAIKMLIIDPDVKNKAAIRAYEKVGFTFARLVDDPYWGMQYLMYLDPKGFSERCCYLSGINNFRID